MSTNSTENSGYLSGNYDSFNGKIFLTAVIIFFIILTAYITMQCLNRSLLAGHMTMPNGLLYHLSSVRPANNQPDQSTRSSSGLHPSTIAALPIVAYQKGSKDTNCDESVECTVCLGQLEEGEKVRALPRCQHLFHAGCIDMWLFSHSTCPVCRADAEPPDSLRLLGSLAGLANEKEPGSTSAPHPSIEVGQDLERQC
jgi:E3 ubiquitin-protein ligase ATL41